MNQRSRILAFLLLLTSVLTAQLSFEHVEAQAVQAPRKRFAVQGYYTWPTPCHPVMVNSTTIGANPPEILTAQASIVSFSAKPVVAVRLKWNVYRYDVAMKKRKGGDGCEPSAEKAEIFLSGTTPLIMIGKLLEKEVCTIGPNPLAIVPPRHEPKVVFIDRPIIMWDEVKSLTVDGTRNTFKDNYAAVVFVSEIQFDDGSTWTGDI
jgi:hypothetical protein